ncbi:hypothetical protein [Streptomyces clavuligerus]|nr:hypothetical protein [Streptomyces clavuligerus]WDN57036.1 hypothetical protein LL058_35170 [Streptomyces clavuligerus]
MSIPQGAHKVNYYISQYAEDGSVESALSFSLPLEPDPELTDRAAAAAAQGIVDTFKAAHPHVPVRVGRGYDCKVPGAPWPSNPA